MKYVVTVPEPLRYLTKFGSLSERQADAEVFLSLSNAEKVAADWNRRRRKIYGKGETVTIRAIS